jgi:hypothetical protein
MKLSWLAHEEYPFPANPFLWRELAGAVGAAAVRFGKKRRGPATRDPFLLLPNSFRLRD